MDDKVVAPEPVFAPPGGTAVGNTLENGAGQVTGRLTVKWCCPSELWTYVGDGGLDAAAVTTWKARDLTAEAVGFGVVVAWLERRRGLEWGCSCAQVLDALSGKGSPDLALG